MVDTFMVDQLLNRRLRASCAPERSVGQYAKLSRLSLLESYIMALDMSIYLAQSKQHRGLLMSVKTTQGRRRWHNHSFV